MTTGACASGCAYEWAGPGCQYKNIALEEESRHSDNMIPAHFSSLAIDRFLTTCSYTGNATTTRHKAPWWAIWYHNDVTFREFDFVTLDSHLNCEDRVWGNTCKNICGFCKDLEQCNLKTGHCSGGCEYGYKDTLSCSRECTDGFYGYSCIHRCSENCIGHCSKIDGTCLSCKAGWKGDICSTECTSDKWGKDCSDKCGNCLNGSCNKFDGFCKQGCMPGFKSSNMCIERCDSGTYGFDCYQNCSKNCARPYVCDAINGACGCCITGWKGKHCDIVFDEVDTGALLKLSGGEVAGAVVVVILLIVVSILMSILLTVFILRRKKCIAESRCHKKPESTKISYANVAAGLNSNKESRTE